MLSPKAFYLYYSELLYTQGEFSFTLGKAWHQLVWVLFWVNSPASVAISSHLFIGYLAEPLLIRLLPALHSWTLFLGANKFSIKLALQNLMH